MIKIDIQRALTLVKEHKPINLAEQLINRFNVLAKDRIERLYSLLYYSGKIDLINGSERKQLNMVKAGISKLSKITQKSEDRMNKNLLDNHFI